jgi:hypothetical protein
MFDAIRTILLLSRGCDLVDHEGKESTQQARLSIPTMQPRLNGKLSGNFPEPAMSLCHSPRMIVRVRVLTSTPRVTCTPVHEHMLFPSELFSKDVVSRCLCDVFVCVQVLCCLFPPSLLTSEVIGDDVLPSLLL